MSKNINTPKLRFKEFSGEWEEKKLNDIAIFHNSKRIPLTESDRKTGKYPYYGASGIIDYVEDYLFDGEYILLGEDGANIILRNSRLVFLANGKFWVNNHAHVFQSKESNYFLCESLERLNYSKYNTGTAQPKLNSEVLRNIKINLPQKQEQEKIASFLTSIDKKIEQLSKKDELLESYKKGVMQKIFSQEIRFKADDGSDYSDWEEKKLEEIIDRYDNLRIPISSSNRISGNTPYYGANGIQDYVQGYTHEGEFILIAEDGANDLRNYPIQYVNGRVWVNNHAHVLQAKKDIANNKFLKYSFSKINIEPFLVGGGRAKLNANIMMKINTILPCIEEQTKIANFLSSIDTKISQNTKTLEETKKFKKALLQQMFV